MEKTPKNAAKFYCESCDFGCSKQCDWDRHLSTRKHENRTISNKKNAETLGKSLVCRGCGKEYSARNSLWYHMKKCDGLSSEQISNTKEAPVEELDNKSLTREILLQLLKNSQELVKITKEKNDVPTTIHNNNTTHNTTNAHFNVNFFLNEKCKDAINFTDFLNSITLDQSDLQTVVKHGQIEGSSRIIASILEKLGVYQRPIHCMDVKRETVYIRENDEWEKEQVELPRIKKLANVVSHKVIQQSGVWHEQNPDFLKDSEKKEESLKIMTQVFSGDLMGEGPAQKRLIKNIIQNVEVDKVPEKVIKGTSLREPTVPLRSLPNRGT